MQFQKYVLFPAFLAVFLTGTVSAKPHSESADVRVVYSVDEVRSGRFVSTVMLTNMTASTISDWTMSFRMDSEIVGIEHVLWSRFSNVVDIKGAGWTLDIEPGEVVWFTISGVLQSAVAETPRDCFFNGVSCTVEAANVPEQSLATGTDMIIASWISEEDQTTYTGHVFIRNPTTNPLPFWNLTFSTSSLISSMEHVEWARTGSSYSVTGTAWTHEVPPGGFVFFTFSGVHTGSAQLPQDCVINEQPCEFVEPDHVVVTPRLNVSITVDEFSEGLFEGVVIVENPTDEDLDTWTLRFTMPDLITEMEGVYWSRGGSNQYIVRGENGKRRIQANSSTWFVIRGFVSGTDLEPPEGCTVNGVLCLLKSEGFTKAEEATEDPEDPPDDGGGSDEVTCASSTVTSVLPNIDFRFLSVTSTRWVALIDITNVGNGVIKGWNLAFRLVDGMTVSRFWNGVLTQNPGGDYSAVNDASNECILPGGKAQFGFEGTHDGNYGEPIGCQFGGKICIFLRFSSVDTEEEKTPLPGGLRIDSAYPNPFYPTARIDFTSEETQQVRLELWDMLGRKVDQLYEGVVGSGETRSARIQADDLASGMYFVRLVSQDGAMATQAVVVRR